MSEISKLAAALVKAMAEVKNPAFDSTNPHFKNKFASLAAVRSAVVPVFAKHGLAILQPLVSDERGVGVATIIVHESGERLDLPTFYLPAAKHDPQGFGSAATYARRYGLMAVAGVVGDEDDDAERAQDAHKNAPPYTIEQAAAELKAAPTLAALKSKWDTLPADFKEALGKVKDARKGELTEKAA